MAHLKLELLLRETGYKPNGKQRLRIYLTNSLEEHHPDTGTLFASWLSKEANEANHIKRDTPVMVVLGNPPYSVSSSNKGEWIQNLIADYKKNLHEKKLNLDDDYIKFIRYGEFFIEKNGEGILAYISNNSFIDGVTHRQMRKHLLDSFNKVYIIDLHGNSRKKETCLDGSKDENVFDIMQGVSINIFIKTGKKNKLGEIYHYDLYGKRDEKYPFLFENSINKIQWEKLENDVPYYFFVPKDFETEKTYKEGLLIKDLMKVYVSGVETVRDKITIHLNNESLKKVLYDFINLDEETISKKYQTEDARDWKISRAKNDVIDNIENNSYYQNITYRPFDIRYTFYTGRQNGFVCNGRYNVMKHLLNNNIALLVTNKNRQLSYGYFFISKFISDRHSLDSAADSMQVFPLYLYPKTNVQQTLDGQQERTPNLNKEILQKIARNLGLTFTNEKEKTKDTFAPIDLLDYIYAVLHSPTYREKYKEFLKIDFPRVPYPKDQDTFWKFVKLGGEIRQIHLLESSIVEKYITTYPQDGNNAITRRIRQKDFEITDDQKGIGRVWINDEQYFDKVPVIAWEFYIGGYQPAQKWLKDRYGRILSYEDIMHYQKIIVALTETDRIMKEIDKIEFE